MKFTEQLAALSLLLSTASAECLVGQISVSAGFGSFCRDCPAGTYANTTTRTTCTACPTTTYSGATAERCTDCTTGTTQFDLSTNNVASDSCSTGCSAGYGYTSSGCTVCSAGEYTNNVTMANVNVEGCNSCPTGFHSDGVTPSSSCLMCAAGFGTTSCSTCRTGTTSEAALIAVAECSMCTNDVNGCYGNGACATGTGVCTCESGWTGTFCGEFDTSVVDTAVSVTAVEVDTGTTWSADYADSTSAAYTALAARVCDAAVSTFETSAADGFILKSCDVTLAQSEDAVNRRRKRATNTVVANAELSIEHPRTVTAVDLITFVNIKTATTVFTDTWGFTASDAEITTDNTSSSDSVLWTGLGALALMFIL